MITNLKIHYDLFLTLFLSETKKKDENEKILLNGKSENEILSSGDIQIVINETSTTQNESKNEKEEICNIITNDNSSIHQVMNKEKKNHTKKIKYCNQEKKKINSENSEVTYRTETPLLYDQLVMLSTYTFRDFELRPKLRKLLRKALKVFLRKFQRLKSRISLFSYTNFTPCMPIYFIMYQINRFFLFYVLLGSGYLGC